MPKFRYLGDAGRVYVARGLVVQPDDVHEWPEAPDHRWVPVEPEPDPAPKAKKASA